MTYAEKKAIENSIGRRKNDIGKRKGEDKNTAMLRDDDGSFGEKARERKTTATIEKKLQNL